MIQYSVVCRRSGGWWSISVPELKGVYTQAENLEQVEEIVRDAIALFLGVAPNTFDIEIHQVSDE